MKRMAEALPLIIGALLPFACSQPPDSAGSGANAPVGSEDQLHSPDETVSDAATGAGGVETEPASAPTGGEPAASAGESGSTRVALPLGGGGEGGSPFDSAGASSGGEPGGATGAGGEAPAYACDLVTYCGDEIDPPGDADTRYYFCAGAMYAAPCPGKCEGGYCGTGSGNLGSDDFNHGCRAKLYACVADLDCTLRWLCDETCSTSGCEADCAARFGESALYQDFLDCLAALQ